MHSSADPIGFIDSGVGGLPYLEWIQKHLPNENLVYVADNALFPYGEHSHDEIRESLNSMVSRLVERYNPKIIVVACNTASVIGLDFLREQYDVPFVGVVPAVKPAAAVSKSGHIGVLATARTAEDPYTFNLIRDFAGEKQVYPKAGGDIVRFVEEDLFSADSNAREKVLGNTVSFFKERNVDTLVLGCTHFIYIADDIKRLWGDDVTLVDSREGVGNQTIRVLIEQDLLFKGRKNGFEDSFHITGNQTAERYKKFADKFNLIYKGVL